MFKYLQLSLLSVLAVFMSSCGVAESYNLVILLNNEPITFEVEAPAKQEGSRIFTDQETVIVKFSGGQLELNLADWNQFDYAHVLATSFKRTSPGIYTVNATIRHNDQGWDNYADAFEVKGDVENGLRVLLHPHDDEQPFTRSQADVKASGLVWVEAKDNVEGLGGSKIYLDLASLALETVELSYELNP